MRISDWSSDVCSSDLNRPFSSLLLAVREKGGLRYAGRVGSGFDDATLDELGRRLGKLRRDTPAVTGEIPAPVRRAAPWVRRSEERRGGEGLGSTCRTRGRA